MYMTTAAIRAAFLEFFRSHDHQVVPSSLLVPQNDPTLLFTNAGMNQFKDVYLGRETRPYRQATTAQKCVRAGGKHNDLDNVGYTARHHTFFEMLGNFSFGGYFKREALHYAWELLTHGFALPPASLLVTVYADDDEAYDIWRSDIGLDAGQIVRIGDNKGGAFNSDNFWQMGDTGPCGPCSEIFYDHGPDVPGGPPGSPDEDGDRFIEIWNIVFMQYNRQSDGGFEPLARPMIDTGMGLERVAAVLQGVHSNYDTDVFRTLIAAAGQLLGCPDHAHKSLHVIADHIRSSAFLIADGVLPSNEGRGYVLRRIIRRAVRHGRMLGSQTPFFHRMAAPLADLMGEAYPELGQHRALIEQQLQGEEEQFLTTLDRGLALLEEELGRLGSQRTLPGEVLFRLYDTYGFPTDLTQDIARERGLGVDLDGFEQCMARQRSQAQRASRFAVDYNQGLRPGQTTLFEGYAQLEDESPVSALFCGGEPVDTLRAGQEGAVVLERTVFYAEKGGQCGDRGVLETPSGRFSVHDTQVGGQAVLHVGVMEEGEFSLGQQAAARVAAQRRARIAAHHSATHLLHAALRAVLGDHVAQKGSAVDDERLRFDFSHPGPLSAAERQAVADLVNAQIRANFEVTTQIMGLEQARKRGAMALFGEKYGEEVRVVSMGEFSMELCGGTHVRRTGDLGQFMLVSDEAVASGVRRIEARAGEAGSSYAQALSTELSRTGALLHTEVLDVADKVRALQEQHAALRHEHQRLRERLVAMEANALAAAATQINGVALVAGQLEGCDPRELRGGVDVIRQRLGRCVVVLGSAAAGKVSLVAAVSPELTDRLTASALVSQAAAVIGGKGGGRAEMAQAGGSRPEKLGEALQAVPGWVRSQLG